MQSKMKLPYPSPTSMRPLTFARNLSGKCVDSKFGMSIGSMHGVLGDDDVLFVTEVSAAHAEPTKGVSAKQLSKLGLEFAERTLKIMSHRRKQDSELSLSRNLSTNDRML